MLFLLYLLFRAAAGALAQFFTGFVGAVAHDTVADTAPDVLR